MKSSFPALRAGSLRSPARSAGKEGQSQTTTTNNQIKSTKFISGLDRIQEASQAVGVQALACCDGFGERNKLKLGLQPFLESALMFVFGFTPVPQPFRPLHMNMS
jgi:hypothetical protein